MKNNTPLVSVIIPVYNEEKYLGFCLESLKKQTYKNLEIIVVDDGSTDKSKDTANKYSVRLFEQSHSGPGNARNLGASKANGEILAFLDADMKYDKEFVKKLIKPIRLNKAVGTIHGKELVANQNNVWSNSWTIESRLPKGQRTPLQMPSELGVFRAIKKSSFDEVNGYDPDLGYFDDTSLSKKLNKKSLVVRNAVAYHYNPETLTEVFVSTRWIGRSGKFPRNLHNFIRFSFLNSIRLGVSRAIATGFYFFIFFKIVYDFGLFYGIFIDRGKKFK